MLLRMFNPGQCRVAVLSTQCGCGCLPYQPEGVCLHADNPEESVENVLTPLHRFNPALGIRSGSYWSSKGSDDEQSSEWLALRLAHPLCSVSAIGVMPFLAFFQRVCHPFFVCLFWLVSLSLIYCQYASAVAGSHNRSDLGGVL